MYIAIEGNIGAGKSTVLPQLAEKLGFEIIREGIETDKGFQDCLAEFYDKGDKVSFDQLQEYLAHYRATIIQNLDPSRNYIMERSLQGAALFCIAENHTDTATWTLQSFKHVEQPSHYIFLDCPADVCLERIIQRGRECEKDMPLDYLQRVERAHQDWGRMAEWAGQATVVNSNDTINFDHLVDHLKTVLTVKGHDLI